MRAKLRNLRIAPKKVRVVANYIKGKNVKRALYELKYLSKNASSDILKLLKSAVSNAKLADQTLKEENLEISKVLVFDGLSFKRYKARAFGRAATIKKRTSNVEISLERIVKVNERNKIDTFIEKSEISNKIGKDKKLKEIDKKKKDSKSKVVSKNKKEDGKKGNKRVDLVKKMFRRKSI